MTNFADSFWNAEYCNFSGFEVLCQRMQTGKQMLKAYSDFLKQKAQAQDAYGKALIRLARNAGGRDEIGSLKLGWNSLCCQTEAIGLAHVDAAKSIMEQALSMMTILDCQREQRKRVENDVRKSQTNLKVHYKKTIECKKQFDTKFKEKISMAQAEDTISQNGSLKEIEKLTQKRLKSCQMVELADSSYRGALENLNLAYNDWEKRTTAACDLFQLLEEERIGCLRNSMWVLTNVGSSCCVKEDADLEEIRKDLELCDVKSDMDFFIQTNRTGSIKPIRIEYGNDMSLQLSDNKSSPPFKVSNLAQKLEDFSQSFFNKSVAKNCDVNVPSVNNGIYESIDELALQADLRRDYRVKYDFEAKNPGELSVRINDVVHLVYKESDLWWEVKTRNGIQGFVPAQYLELR